MAPAAVTTECSVCGFAIHAGDTACSQCGTSIAKPPILSLFRLLSIAKSYWAMSVLGTILTLAATASGLIAPYLTMPLLDDILVPYQSGRPAQLNMIPWYLAGLAGASVLAWLLTWGEMYVMSWVSESVSAELRDRTYSHLQKLSLEYFGGKRTGDLMSRISSDTDRICYFLVGLRAGLRNRRADAGDDRRHPAEDQLQPGAGNAVPAAVHRICGIPGARTPGAWLFAGQPGLGRL